jgi:Tfp pilus assembly protein PilF
LTGPRAPIAQDVADCRKLTQRSVGALEHGDLTTAQSLAQRAVKTNPQDAQAHQQYSEALRRAGDTAAATEAARAATRLAPEDPLMAVRLGELLLQTGDATAAEQQADIALEYCPNCAEAWALRGRARAQAGKLDAAAGDLQRALTMQPNNAALLLDTAELYRRRNQPQRALSLLGSLHEVYPEGEEPPQLLLLEAEALAALDRHRDATRVWRELARRVPNPEYIARAAQSQEREALAGTVITGNPSKTGAMGQTLPANYEQNARSMVDDMPRYR